MAHSDPRLSPPPVPPPLPGELPSPGAAPVSAAAYPGSYSNPVPAYPQSAVPVARPVLRPAVDPYLPPPASSPGKAVSVKQAYQGHVPGTTGSSGVVLRDADKNEEKFDLYTTLKNAPAWLLSSIIHMIALILLGILTIEQMAEDDIALTVFTAELGDQLIDESAPIALDPVQVEELDMSNAELAPVLDPFAAPTSLEIVPDGMFASSDLGTPIIGNALSGRQEGSKQFLLAKYGGTEATENAVALGLEWLKRNQRPDGSWSLKGPFKDGSYSDNEAAATAMALLAFQGAGNTHLKGDYRKEVERGWNALLKMQTKDGNFQPASGYSHNHLLYTHAQATIALCELYGMTKDSKFRTPAERAIKYCVESQDPMLGGWKYQPRVQSDLSVTGWFVMALQSAKMAELAVPASTLSKVSYFLDSVQHDEGATYSYQAERNKSLSMTAEGLLCRQYLGWKQDNPALLRGVAALNENRISYDSGKRDVYYWYYAAQVTHHMGGKPWDEWNKVMAVAVPAMQVKKGPERGSWDPGGDAWGSEGGRLYVTCLSIYMLEVYYRHLPIYKSAFTTGFSLPAEEPLQ